MEELLKNQKLCYFSEQFSVAKNQGVCTEAGMYALRERRMHITMEDFELAAAKVMAKNNDKDLSRKGMFK